MLLVHLRVSLRDLVPESMCHTFRSAIASSPLFQGYVLGSQWLHSLNDLVWKCWDKSPTRHEFCLQPSPCEDLLAAVAQVLPFCTKSTLPAAVRLWVHCPALPPYKGAVVTWSGVPWLGEPATPVFIVHLHYLYRQILWADEFHPKQLSWLVTKPHLVVSAPSASHRHVALFGHCIMKATFTSCEGHLKISSDF